MSVRHLRGMPRRRAAVLVGVLVPLLMLTATPAQAVENGPAPTPTSVTVNGTFAFTSVKVANAQTPGFGAATIFYPTSTAQTYGAIAVSPGFLSDRSFVAWYGRRLASHGFVVITINTQSRFDDSSRRAIQLLAALDYLVQSSPVRDRVDPDRLAVMGHSAGGGGALEAAQRRPSLRATIALQPAHTRRSFPSPTPAFVLGGEADTIAPPSVYAEPMYEALRSVEKAYLEQEDADHFAPASDDPTISTYVVAWFKRFLDGDTRYDQFLCPPPVADQITIEEYRSTCPTG